MQKGEKCASCNSQQGTSVSGVFFFSSKEMWVYKQKPQAHDFEQTALYYGNKALISCILKLNPFI